MVFTGGKLARKPLKTSWGAYCWVFSPCHSIYWGKASQGALKDKWGAYCWVIKIEGAYVSLLLICEIAVKVVLSNVQEAMHRAILHVARSNYGVIHTGFLDPNSSETFGKSTALYFFHTLNSTSCRKSAMILVPAGRFAINSQKWTAHVPCFCF